MEATKPMSMADVRREVETERKINQLLQDQLQEAAEKRSALENELAKEEKNSREKLATANANHQKTKSQLKLANQNNESLAVGFRKLEEASRNMTSLNQRLMDESKSVKEAARTQVAVLKSEHSKELKHTISTAQRAQGELAQLRQSVANTRVAETASSDKRVTEATAMAQAATQRVMVLEAELDNRQRTSDSSISALQREMKKWKSEAEEAKKYSPEQVMQWQQQAEENDALRNELLKFVQRAQEHQKEADAMAEQQRLAQVIFY